MADKLLKLACSKDIADDKLSDWIEECSVGSTSMDVVGKLLQIKFNFVVMKRCIYFFT